MTEQTRARVVLIAVLTTCGLAIIGVGSLCLTMFYKNYADPAVLTAIIAITTGATGSLGTIAGYRSTSLPQPPTPPDIKVSSEPPSVEVKQPEQPKP